jgi:hypothetical protein
VAAQLSALVGALRATPGLLTEAAHSAGELTSRERDALVAVIAELQRLLEQDDSEAQGLWDSHAAGLHALLKQAQQVEAAISGFDFEEALRLLQLEA